MNEHVFRKWMGSFSCSLLCLLLTAGTGHTLDVYLAAKQFTQTMPDGRAVNMWGFALDADGNLATDGGEVPTAPGPVITVPPGDPVLNIHLRNDLAGEGISVVIPGQATALAPVVFTDPQGRQRVRSFTAETAPGQIGTYSWNNMRPGSYLYHSGSHPAIQVQMGLYGAVKKDSALGMAYAGIPYDNEAVLLYSEIDPLLHDAIAGAPVDDPLTPVNETLPTYGTINGPTSTIDYEPKYFLINGASYPDAQPLLDHALVPNETLLVRLLNAGFQTHTAQLQGPVLSVVAEDGNPYPFQREQYSVLLPAGKTSDALFTPQQGSYAIYDRNLNLTNGAQAYGGMLTTFTVAAAAPCLGDLNNDGFVNLADFIVLRSQFGRLDCSVASPCSADLDGNGSVNLADFITFRAAFGTTCP